MSTLTPACLNQPLSMAICQGVQPGQSLKPIFSGVSARLGWGAAASPNNATVSAQATLAIRFIKTSCYRIVCTVSRFELRKNRAEVREMGSRLPPPLKRQKIVPEHLMLVGCPHETAFLQRR